MKENNCIDSHNQNLIEDFKKLRRENNPQLRDQLITDNLYIVSKVAKKFRSINESQEDLIQVGYIGLIKSVDNFDPDRQIKFITYATHCIMGEIRHYIRDKTHCIKQPRWLTKLHRDMAQYVEKYLQENQKLPTISQISEALNIESEGIVEIFKAKYMVSLSDINQNYSDNIVLNKIKSIRHEDFQLPIEDRIVLEQAIDSLKVIEQRVIYLFFYHDLTQTQIAVNLGLSQKKVSRMLKKSIDKLRDLLYPEGDANKKKQNKKNLIVYLLFTAYL